MKKFVTYLVFIVIGTALYAAPTTYEKSRTIILKINACGPIKVTAQKIQNSNVGGSIGPAYVYSVNEGDGWDLRVRINSATDCNGNSCSVHCEKQTQRKQYPNGIRINNYVYYTVIEETWVYTINSGGRSNTETSTTNSGGSSSYGQNSYTDYSRAAEFGRTMGQLSMQSHYIEKSYNNYNAGGFSLSANISAWWGENMELRFRYGSSYLGGDVTGMVGYDFIHRDYGDKVCWNVGLGMYFGGRPSDIYLWDVGLGVKFGQSNIPYPKSVTMMIDVNTTHMIGPLHIVGLTAGAGIGLAGNKDPGFAFDLRAGIVVYFLQWDWF